ncbi:P-loop NTPase fold protein [Flavobacterium sp. Root186]|uniref:KAP family P-loop NTPase fold protein n=1 Tax=Flavobacterium sp. Root186 TaxID=1736485 RepID=UPI0006F7E4A4|nr:P-loop NTPase fold protein [Flavobacterium sp. Root186]KRB57436.1 hypothetical protein ASD98_03890 [Flavobacterium sp. Root186]
MSLKHKEIEIQEENPFENCKLDREKYGTILTTLVKNYSDGFVLAINNKWGAGKTTFVKMWEQDLKNNSYQTVYFNAWENDFENNPLTALMGELKTLTTKETEPKFQTALKNAALLSKHILPTIVEAIADKYIGNTKEIKETIVNISKGISDIFENDVNDYAKKKIGINEFKKSLSEFIANTNEGKPVIFIIDELDRCRPNYSVSILEQIKHFFSIPNIVFILSIDKTQLGNAVRGVYGNDRIDSDEYLRRFIDLEYSIPEPDKEKYYKYLYEYFDFEKFFNSNERLKHRDLSYDGDYFLKTSELLFNNSQISLRTQEKIFSLARLALRSFASNSSVIPSVFLILIYIKITDDTFYDEIKSKKLTIEQLQDNFFIIFKNKISSDTEDNLMLIESYFVLFYNNFIYSRYDRRKLYEKDEADGNKLIISSVINPNKNYILLDNFERIKSNRTIDSISLGYFLNKIDLTENIVI